MIGLIILFIIIAFGWEARRVDWRALALIALAAMPATVLQAMLTNAARTRMGEPATMMEPAALATRWAITVALWGGVYVLAMAAGWAWRRVRSQG